MEPRYHVYVRLPLYRGDFVDPPPVNWDERHSEALWSIISGVSQTEINWNELAAKFDVTVEFLLQMVSYLTERHTSQLRAQMRKVATAKGSSAPSPIPGAEPPVGFPIAEAMRGNGSGGGGRAPSALSVRKDDATNRPATPTLKAAALPVRPQVSRNSSANTVAAAAAAAAKPPARPSDAHRRRLSIITPGSPAQETEPPLSPGPAESSTLSTEESSSSGSSSPVESRIIRRPPRFQPPDGGGDGADDEEEAEPAFLPFKAQQDSASSTGGGGQDMGATLRGDARDFGRRLPKASGKSREQIRQSQTSDSSTSSAAMVPRRPTGDRKPLGPLSPRRTAELTGRRSSGSKKGKSREGSDGTPSMGSSFSDLDDASVTQSALEEALASRMQDGGIGSRMSTIGNAIRSRYLPRSTNRQ
ncbi:hypothetical protein B0H66DRAFT_635979 [Apodospora peruviana]|uniref:Autophagy-related protein 29 n=1 Tax=Apodospora peruviana TaxID=516989 RepID=A0AAE0MGN8_9PEZI|nr:hypothetical protein B0H66DRAFT_635979 [Apodospora peruviana]